MMRHHNGKILASCFPYKKRGNAIDVEPTLAHVDKFHGKPEKINTANLYTTNSNYKQSIHYKSCNGEV